MTDNDIIKALECCIKEDCENCPYFASGLFECGEHFNEDVLNLINRQKAEIEEWKKILESRHRVIDSLEDSIIGLPDQIRAEAVKEFAERFFETLRKKGLKGYMFNFSFYYADDVEDSIKEVTKEMVGES